MQEPLVKDGENLRCLVLPLPRQEEESTIRHRRPLLLQNRPINRRETGLDRAFRVGCFCESMRW